MLRHSSDYAEQRWLTGQNMTGEMIPAFAACKFEGATTDQEGIKLFKVTAESQDVVINGPMEIPVDGVGSVTNDFPTWALFETADGNPLAGESYGASVGSYKLKRGRTGFIVWSADFAKERLLVAPPLAAALQKSHVTGTTQSVGAGTTTAISWTGTNSFFWKSTQPTRFSVPIRYPSGMKFLLVASGRLGTTDVTKNYGCGWRVNGTGTGTIDDDDGGPCSNSKLKLMASESMVINPGEYVEFCVKNSDTVARSFVGISALILAMGT